MERNHVALVKDPVHGSIDLTLLEKALLGHHLVDRLQNIKQLALVYRVFPGATHTRLIHSLGTMHIAWQIFKYSLANADDRDRQGYLKSLNKRVHRFSKTLQGDKAPNPLINKWATYIVEQQQEWNDVSERYHNVWQVEEALRSSFGKLADLLSGNYGNGHEAGESAFCKAMTSWILGPYFQIPYYEYKRVDAGKGISCNLSIALVAQALRLKALLHDIGHLPYSHILEFALTSGEAEENCQTSASKRRGLRSLHEQISRAIELSLLFDATVNANVSLEGMASADLLVALQVLTILLIGLVSRFDAKGMFPELYRSLISAYGSVDADRIDYVLRDGFFTGMLQSTGDYERVYKTFVLKMLHPTDFESQISGFAKQINNAGESDGAEEAATREDLINQMPFYRHSDDQVFVILPSIHGLNDVSQILVDRYRLAKNVNNHHRVRRLDGVLQEVVELILALNVKLKKENKPEKKGASKGGHDRDYVEELLDLEDWSQKSRVEAVKAVIKDFEKKKNLIDQLADISTRINLENPDSEYSRAIDEVIKHSLEFSEFTDDWVVSKFRELFIALRPLIRDYSIRQQKLKGTNSIRSRENELWKLNHLLEEFLSRRRFVSLWKRETDFLNIMISRIPQTERLQAEGVSQGANWHSDYCKIWVIMRFLVNELPCAWRPLVNRLEARLLGRGGPGENISAVLFTRNTMKPSISEKRPLFLTELSATSPVPILRGEFLQPSLQGIAADNLLDIPFFAYVLPKFRSAEVNKAELAQEIFSEILAFYEEYIYDEAGGQEKPKRHGRENLKKEVEKCKGMLGMYDPLPLDPQTEVSFGGKP